MELEKQVCSLELAKKLKDLGVTRSSEFIWVAGKTPYVRDSDIRGCRRCGAVTNGLMPPRVVPTYAALTVAELGEMLQKQDVRTGYSVISHQYVVSLHDTTGTKIASEHEDIEADARAKMLIYLIENRLITEQSPCATKS